MNRAVAMAWCAAFSMTLVARAFQPANERPARAPDRPADRRAGEQPPADREVLKTFLKRRLEEQHRRQEAFEQALKRLEEGTDPGTIRSELEAGGGGRRGGGGSGDRRGDRFSDVDEPPMPPRDMGPVTPEQREETLKFLEEVAPRMAARMREISSDRVFGRLRGKVEELRAVQKHDPELFGLKVAEIQGAYGVMEGGRMLRDAARSNAASEELRRARQQLKEAIGLHFDQQVAVQQHEVKRLTERLEKLQGQIKERKEGRDRLIERQVEEMTNRSTSEGPGEHRKNRPPPE